MLARLRNATLLTLLLASPALAAGPVDNGDGTWSLPRVSTKDVHVRGALTFTYVGQDRFPFEPLLPDAFASKVTDDPPERLEDQLLGRIHHDANGERWRVTAVDEKALDPDAVASVDARIAEWKPDPSLPVGEEESWIPGGSWDVEDCVSPFGFSQSDTWVYDGESRNKKLAPFSDRQETAVQVHVPGAGMCSGVLLLNRWVLTAGHCVVDGNGLSFGPPEDFEIENVYGSRVTGLFVEEATGFSGAAGDSGDDWALIKTTASFPQSLPNMDLFGGSDSAYKDIDAHVHNLGFPNSTLSASGNCLSNGGSALFHQSNGEVTSTTTKKVKLKADASKGNSGGPFYFCPAGPNDTCGPGEKGEVVGVFSGFINGLTQNRLVGPKVTNFRDAALATIEAVNNP